MPAVNSTDQNARFIAGCLFLTLAAVISLKAIASYPFISLQSLSAQRGNVQIFDWFVGFTPDVVTATWAGNDDNRAVAGNHVTGGGVMAAIWHDYMQAYLAKRPAEALAFAASVYPLTKVAPFSIANCVAGGLEEVGDGIEKIDDGIEETFSERHYRERGVKTFFGRLVRESGRIFLTTP